MLRLSCCFSHVLSGGRIHGPDIATRGLCARELARFLLDGGVGAVGKCWAWLGDVGNCWPLATVADVATSRYELLCASRAWSAV